MRSCIFFILCLAFSALSGAAHAVSMQHTEGPMVKCHVTPSMRTNDNAYPGAALNRTNNLRRATGSGDHAAGEPILIKGRVLDSKCLAVADARIEIWHADAQGQYKYPSGVQEADANFVGSGVAETNNLGEYTFLTILPGRENPADSSFINVRVSKANFPTLNTRLYFTDIGNPDEDPTLGKIVQEQRSLLQAIPLQSEDDSRTYLFNIVLSGKVPYKRY